MPKPPFVGFRVIFALVNGVVWFVLGYGIATSSSFGMQSAARLSGNSLAIGAATISFFAAFFGHPGAVTAFLDNALAERFTLPPETSWGAGGQLRGVWRYGAARGAALAIVATGVAWAFFARTDGAASTWGRNDFCLTIAAFGAAAGLVQAFLVSNARGLGDLRSAPKTPLEASTAWLVGRIGVQQGVGNAIVSGILAVAAFPYPIDSGARLSFLEMLPDAGATAVIVAGFMATGAGGLVAMDARLGHVSRGALAPLSRGRLVAWTFGVAIPAVALAALLTFALGGVPFVAFVTWKTVLTGATGYVVTILAGRRAIQSVSA